MTEYYNIREGIERLVEMLKSANDIALICHSSPDGDTAGSALALSSALHDMGKKTAVYIPGRLGNEYSFMSGLDSAVYECTKQDDTHDLVVCIDCGDMERLGFAGYLMNKKGRATANIDHHVTNTRYADLNIIDPSAAATGELMLEVIEGLGNGISRDAALKLYVAICTDTGGFAFQNTTARTHMAAAKLVEAGVDVMDIHMAIFFQRSIEKTRLEAELIRSIRQSRGGAVNIGILDDASFKNAGASRPDTEGLIDVLRDINTSKLCALVRAEGEASKVSFRASKEFDVGSIAKSLGGGGHKLAAGCTLLIDVERAAKTVTELLEKHYDEVTGWTEP